MKRATVECFLSHPQRQGTGHKKIASRVKRLREIANSSWGAAHLYWQQSPWRHLLQAPGCAIHSTPQAASHRVQASARVVQGLGFLSRLVWWEGGSCLVCPQSHWLALLGSRAGQAHEPCSRPTPPPRLLPRQVLHPAPGWSGTTATFE